MRYWMPHLRILEPHDWERTLLAELRQTITAWEQNAPAALPQESTLIDQRTH